MSSRTSTPSSAIRSTPTYSLFFYHTPFPFRFLRDHYNANLIFRTRREIPEFNYFPLLSFRLPSSPLSIAFAYCWRSGREEEDPFPPSFQTRSFVIAFILFSCRSRSSWPVRNPFLVLNIVVRLHRGGMVLLLSDITEESLNFMTIAQSFQLKAIACIFLYVSLYEGFMRIHVKG